MKRSLREMVEPVAVKQYDLHRTRQECDLIVELILTSNHHKVMSFDNVDEARLLVLLRFAICGEPQMYLRVKYTPEDDND